MALDYRLSSRFKRDLKRIESRGLDISEIYNVISKIVNEEQLDIKYKNHVLEPRNQRPKKWELHIGGRKSDLVMIYYYLEKNMVVFDRIGSHSDVFR